MRRFNKFYLPANSILEVVIAMSLIASAIALTTTVYVNTNQSKPSLQEISEEGLIKTQLIGYLINQNNEFIEEDYHTVNLSIEKDKIGQGNTKKHYLLSNSRGVKIWQIENYSDR
jgi:hypothetical protein